MKDLTIGEYSGAIIDAFDLAVRKSVDDPVQRERYEDAKRMALTLHGHRKAADAALNTLTELAGDDNDKLKEILEKLEHNRSLI